MHCLMGSKRIVNFVFSFNHIIFNRKYEQVGKRKRAGVEIKITKITKTKKH